MMWPVSPLRAPVSPLRAPVSPLRAPTDTYSTGGEVYYYSPHTLQRTGAASEAARDEELPSMMEQSVLRAVQGHTHTHTTRRHTPRTQRHQHTAPENTEYEQTRACFRDIQACNMSDLHVTCQIYRKTVYTTVYTTARPDVSSGQQPPPAPAPATTSRTSRHCSTHPLGAPLRDQFIFNSLCSLPASNSAVSIQLLPSGYC